MIGADFAAKMRQRRQAFEDFGRIIDEHGGAGGFVPSRDAAFWRDFERIEIAGRERDKTEVSWLASLTQVDDLGPNGRAMFLAFAALDALGQMPAATLAQGKTLRANLTLDASIYRKVSVCKVLEASASVEAIPLIEGLINDDNEPYVQREGEWCLERLRAQVEHPA